MKRRRRHSQAADDDPRDTLVGLALSGGGIRSATTCLGMLQALSRLRILPLVDYLSTVSGGGYVGACLTSLLTLRSGRNGTGPPHFSTEWESFPLNPDHRQGRTQIDHLRTHGSFLVTRTRTARARDDAQHRLSAVGHALPPRASPCWHCPSSRCSTWQGC